MNQREGQNRVGYTVSRLTGDVAAGVLNGDQLPDNCLFILAPDANGNLANANRELSVSQLLYRYYTRGRAAFEATVEGPAPQTAPNTVTGALPVTGIPARILSVKPPREQVSPISGKVPTLALFAPTATYTTNLGTGGEFGKLTVNLRTRMGNTAIYLPAIGPLTAPPAAGGRQFDGSFSQSFH